MGTATERCHNATLVLGFSHSHFLMIWTRIKNMVVEDPKGGGQGTMGMSGTGRLFINPDFVMKMDREEIGGVMAHEMLHLIMQHHGRQGARDDWTWNVAADMCINAALRADGIKLPKDAVYPPDSYQGDLFVEAVYEWLIQKQNQKHMPKEGKDGNVNPTAGCGVVDDTQGNEDDKKGPGDVDWKQVALEVATVARNSPAGSGTGVANLLAPRVAKISWRAILRHGVELASSRPHRDWQSFSKRHRRSPLFGPQFPGWLGCDPRVAVVIDVSGSMDREWIAQIVAECKALMKDFSGISIYLVAHTDEVVWEGWVGPSTQAKIETAVSFSGGTDPKPAYTAVEATRKKFDSLVHFTDCYFFSPEWPQPIPAKKLVVGAFTREIYTKPPPGAVVIPCEIS
jgi:predicted metal-dependent peptidase